MTTERRPDQSPPGAEPDYDRIAAELMQQWQQQFLQPLAGAGLKPEFTNALGQGGAVAQNLMEMGQVLWQGWLQGSAAAPPHGTGASPDQSAAASTGASARQSTYAGGDVPAAAVPNAEPRAAATAAAGPAGATASGAGRAGSASGPAGTAAGTAADTTAAASMAGVALYAELARRLDLLSQRVRHLEQQLEQQASAQP